MQDEVISPYTVRAGTFQGPLELLLSLIESRKLFVNEISLSGVTNDYIEYIKSMSAVPNDKRASDISYFILIASTLILIKSKSLLPNLALSKDEEEKIVDLEHRLKMYQIIRNASLSLRDSFGKKILFTPLDRNFKTVIFAPDQNISIVNIKKSIDEVLNSIPKKSEALPQLEIKKVISLDEMINSLTDRIENAVNLSFNSFAKNHGSANEKEVKVHLIVSFLAMLELVRGGIIDVIQNNHFEDINITKQN
jgi:segregation and condensation protein A